MAENEGIGEKVEEILPPAPENEKTRPDLTIGETEFHKIAGRGVGIGIPEGIPLLGYVVGFVIGERHVPYDLADAEMDRLGMDEKIRPHKARLKDCFKDACANQEREETFTDEVLKKLYCEGARFTSIWKADQMTPEEYIISRKILLVDETKGGKPTDIRFDKIARIRLDVDAKGNIQIKGEPMEAGYQSLATKILKQVKEDFEMFKNNYTAKRLRDALRNCIEKEHGVQYTVGRGGVWFVPKRAEEDLARWREFLKFCNKQEFQRSDYPVHLRILPAIDTDDMKEYIKYDVEQTVTARVHRLLEDTYAKLKESKAEEVEGVLLKKLEEKKESDTLLEDYKKILKQDIGIQLNIEKIKGMKTKDREPLSERAVALLEELSRA